MSNKLKDVFSNAMFDMGITIKFKDHLAEAKFKEALKLVYEEGCSVPVEGIDSIQPKIKSGSLLLPVPIEGEISHVVVGPSVEIVPFTIETENGKMDLQLNRSETKSVIQLMTAPSNILSISIKYYKTDNRLSFSYRINYEKAHTVDEVINSYQAIIGLINRSFRLDTNKTSDEEQQKLQNIINSLQEQFNLWKKIRGIEKQIGAAFSPAAFEYSSQEQLEVNELYAMLVEKKTIRISRKINPNEEASIVFEPNSTVPEKDAEVILTFTSAIHYSLLGHEFPVYTVNLLSNAVIKEVITEEDGKIKVLYGDTDSKPMFISCSAFLTEAEAEKEFKVMMEHKDLYTNAETI